MLEQTIEWKQVRIVVREMINQDLFDTVSVFRKIAPESPEYNYRRNQFSLAIVQTVSTEGLPFEWVSLSASPDKMQACYEAWCHMKPTLGKLWADTIYALNNSAEDEDLAPVVAVGEE